MEDKIITSLDNIFSKEGFKKKGKTWFLDKDFCLIISEYQKSKFSSGFYLNFGVVFKGISNGKRLLKSYDWHLIGRHNQILELTHSLIEVGVDEYLLLDTISQMISNEIIPFLKDVTDISYLKKHFPDNFPHHKLWVQNIKTEDLKTFIITL